MTLFLKQSTAKVISFGPFLDKSDGVTLETGLVSALDHASTGIKLSKNGGAMTIRHATVTATTYDALGMYRVTLDTTDTNALGTLRIAFEEAATCLPVWQDVMVLPANVYDSLVGGSDILDVSMTQILGTAVSTPATAGILDVNIKNAANTAWASGAITAASLATDAAAEIADAVWDADKDTYNNADTMGEQLNSTLASVAALSGQIGAPVGASISADIAALPTAAENADAVWDEANADHVAAGSTGKKLSDLSAATPLDAAGVRSAIGLATANLDSQLDALPTAAENGAATWDAARAAHSTAGTFGQAVSGVAGNVDGSVLGNVGGSVGSVTGNVGGNVVGSVGSLTTNNDKTGYTLSDTGRGEMRVELGLATANLDTQLSTIAGYIDTEVGAIYSRLGAPAGASMSADIAAVKSDSGAIKTKTDYLPSATAGAAGGVFIAGSNAATTVNITGDLTGNVTGSVGSLTTNNDKTGYALSSGERTTLSQAIMDLTDGVTTDYPLKTALNVMLGILAGKLSGAATATITIRDVNDTKNVAVITTDASGNRTATVITG